MLHTNQLKHFTLVGAIFIWFSRGLLRSVSSLKTPLNTVFTENTPSWWCLQMTLSDSRVVPLKPSARNNNSATIAIYQSFNSLLNAKVQPSGDLVSCILTSALPIMYEFTFKANQKDVIWWSFILPPKKCLRLHYQSVWNLFLWSYLRRCLCTTIQFVHIYVGSPLSTGPALLDYSSLSISWVSFCSEA